MGRLPAFGLRGRLAISIAAIMLAVLGITFVAVYRGTEDDLRGGIEDDLEREVDGLARGLSAGPPGTPTEVEARADRLVLAQPFGPSSRVIAISVDNGGTATNQPELLGLPAATGEAGSGNRDAPGAPAAGGEEEEHHGPEQDEHDDGDSRSAKELLSAGQDFSTIPIEDVGDVRLLTRKVGLPGGGAATIRVGQPLEPVERALDGLSDTFLVVGFFGLLLAAAAGWLLANRTTGPMRRMAGVAEGVDGGELSARMPIEETRDDEVRRLAESFNHMLDRLESAFARQREFVGDASHDLRTPLTIVKGQLDVLARNPDPGAEEVQRVAAQVGIATDRMERLIDDLLLLAKSDAGDLIRPEPSEVGPLLVAEVDAFRATADRDFEVGPLAGRSVEMDRDQMSRAISNLLSNAVAHTGDGGTIAVSAEQSPAGIRIAVEDDGPGVPPELRRAVFERFKRLDDSRSSDLGGSGLGLAIVKAIAEAHGGSVGCDESTLGGARFTIDLPGDPAPTGARSPA